MKSNVILHMCNIKKYVMVILNRKQGVACDKYNNQLINFCSCIFANKDFVIFHLYIILSSYADPKNSEGYIGSDTSSDYN